MGNVNEKNLILTRAQGAVLSRDFSTAARLYKQLLKDDPSNIDYLKEIGAIYVKAGEDEKAIPYYEQIITFYPHYIDAMNSLGAIFRRLKRYEESIEILQRAADEGRQTASVNYNLGFTYKEMGNYDDAIDAFEMVIGENPSDVLAHNHLGNIYLAQKQYQKSVSAFKRGLQIDQNHPILNYNLACCYRDAKQYTEAIRYYEAALRVKPGWVDAIKDYSALLIQCQKTKEASDLVKHSIEIHPNDSKLLSILGKIYLDQYDYESAAKMFKRANFVDDKDVTILSGLAEALEKSEKPQEALDAVCKAIEIAPENKDVKKQYVHTLLSAEEYDSAHVNVEDLYADNGQNDPQVLDLYGQYCICVDDEVKASEYFEKIGTISKQYKEHLLSAAGRYSQKGNYNQAERFAKEYIAKNIQNPAGYNVLGEIYTKTGETEKAIESFSKSTHLWKPNIQAEKQLEKLNAKINTPAPVVEAEAPVQEEEEPAFTQPLIMPEEEKEDEAFDFGSMGDNVPMGEALLEEENDFFDELDKALEPEVPEEEEPEEELPETPVEAAASPSEPKENGNGNNNPYNFPDEETPFTFDDDDEISPFSDFDKDEPKSQAQQLVPDADFSDDEEDLMPSPSAASEPFAEEAASKEAEEKPAYEAENKPDYPPYRPEPEDWRNPYEEKPSREEESAASQEKQPEVTAPDSDDFSAKDMLDNLDSDDNFDFDQFGDTGTYGAEEEPAFNKVPETPSYDTKSSPMNREDSGNSNSSPFGNNDGAVSNPAADSDMPFNNNSGFQAEPEAPSKQPQNNPYEEPFAGYQPSQDYMAQNRFAQELENRASQIARDSARSAMDAAMNAQRFAEVLADEQKQLKDEINSLNDALAEQKAEFEKAAEQMYVDSADSVEAPTVEEDLPINRNLETPENYVDLYDKDFGSEENLDNFEDDIEPETKDSFAFDDALDEEFNLDDDFSEEIATLEEEAALDGYSEAEETGVDEVAAEEYVTEQDAGPMPENLEDSLYVPSESENAENSFSYDNVNTEEPQIDAANLPSEIAYADEESFESDETEVQEEELIPDEIDLGENEEFIETPDAAETMSTSGLIQPMMDDYGVDNTAEDSVSPEIELFKKLRSLCDFVPDSERQTNNFGNMKTRIEYIISKMSGKQGLLKTAEEYAPEDFEFEAVEVTSEVDKDLLKQVLATMKNLAADLEDQSVAATLCSKADELLSKLN